MMGMRGHKPDGSKPVWAWMPWSALDQVAKVVSWAPREKGYPPLGYLELEDGAARYASAACRHLSAHLQGKWLDDESGLPHLAHASADILFALAIELRDRGSS